MTTPAVSPELSRVANGRDHLLTSEFAHLIGRSDQTIRQKYCKEGSVYGVRPVKIGRRLMWPVGAIAVLLQGG